MKLTDDDDHVSHTLSRVVLSIRSQDSEGFSAEEVGAFIKSLEEHFYEVFKVKLWVSVFFLQKTLISRIC